MMGNADLSVVNIFSWPEFFCPGERIEVSWATYSVDVSGAQHLEGSSQTLIIDADTSTVTTSVVLPQACTYWVYFLQNANIPSTIPVGANLVDGTPFHRAGSVAPSGIFDRFTGSNCGSQTPVPPHRP
jgi:hypothetical protein